MEPRHLINPLEQMNYFLVVFSNFDIFRLDPVSAFNTLFQSAFGIFVQAQQPDEMSHEGVKTVFCNWIVIVITH